MGIFGQLRDVRELLDLQPDQLDKSKLLPIFVPARFFQHGNWPGPYELLGVEGLGLTWTILGGKEGMRYLDHGIREHWEARGFDWKAAARQNLANLVGPHGEDFCTHVFRRKNQEIFLIVMMHPDCLGPSRLLLADSVAKVFPNGYRVALPEMTCGMAFAASLDETEAATVQKMIDECYQKGTRPLIPGIHAPDEILPR